MHSSPRITKMKTRKIISNWFNVIRKPDETLREIENIGISEGIKSLLLGYGIPAGIVTLVMVFLLVISFLFGGLPSLLGRNIQLENFLVAGAGLLIPIVLYLVVILVVFLFIVIFYTLFAAVVRLICMFTRGEGSFGRDLGIVYFLGGGLIAIFGIMYVILLPIMLVSMLIPLLGILLVLLLYLVLLLFASFISGSYIGALFDLLSRIEKKSLTRMGGIMGVAYAVTFIVSYLIFIAIYLLLIAIFFASFLASAGL
jgi:hypothetical protein